jgi:hypothetical protein
MEELIIIYMNGLKLGLNGYKVHYSVFFFFFNFV